MAVPTAIVIITRNSARRRSRASIVELSMWCGWFSADAGLENLQDAPLDAIRASIVAVRMRGMRSTPLARPIASNGVLRMLGKRERRLA